MRVRQEMPAADPREVFPMVDGTIPRPELQQLWFVLLRQRWSSFAVVPADRDGDAFAVATSLVCVGAAHLGARVRLVDARSTPISQAPMVAQEIRASEAAGALVVVACDSLLIAQGSLGVALGADRALVVVDLGRTAIEAARRTIELLGRDRVVGAVAVRGDRSAGRER